MAMSPGGSGDYKSDINITPLVDVVLVLLIIFMVITPLLQMGYDVKVPPKTNTYLNKQELTVPQLATQLSSILKNRRDKTVFFSGDDGATYGDVAKVMDLCRSAGATNIGIVLETVPIQ